MNELQGLVVPIEARIDKLEKGLAKANRVQKRSSQQMERRANQSANKMRKTYGRMGDDVAKGFKKMALPLIAGVASVQTVRQIAATTRAVAQLGDEAKRSGVGLQTFQEWKFVAEQNRIGVDQMIDGLKELNLRGDEFAKTGKGPAAEAFDRIGFSADQMSEKLKDPSAFLLEIIGRMEKLSKAGQIRVSDELFGGSAGERFVELISQGEDGLRNTINRAHDLGIVLDESVVKRADELDRKFNALLTKVSTLGKKIAVASADLAVAVADDIGSIGDGPDPLAGLTASYSQLEDKAHSVGLVMLNSVSQLRNYGYADVANEVFELSNRAFDAAQAFADGTIEGEAFSTELGNIQQEAQAAYDKLDDVDKADFPNAISALAGLGGKLLETLGVAQSLKGVLDAINNQDSGPSQIQTFREAEAESVKNFEASQKKLKEFLGDEKARNGYTKERLDLEREIISVQKKAKDQGVTLTTQQATTAATARIAGNAARNPASTSTGGGGGTTGGSDSRTTSEWDDELTNLAEESAALRLEAQELLNVTDAQIKRGNATDLARSKSQLLNAALRSGLSDTPALRAQIDGLANEYVNASSAAELAASKIEEVQNASRAGADSIASAFIGLASGALTAEQAVAQLIIQIIKLSLKKRLLEAAGAAGGFLGKAVSLIGGGFSGGGYTGDGGKHQVAGTVHHGEFVMSKAATSAIGVGNLERMHTAAKRGYADGGLVGGNVPRIAANTSTAPSISISAPITVNGSAGSPEQNDNLARKMSVQLEGSMRGVVVDELRRQMRPGNMISKSR